MFFIYLFVCLFVCFPSLAEALQCYFCYNLVSWDDCDKDRVKQTCAPGLDKCAKVYAKGIREVFGRGCESSYQCSSKSACEISGLTKCEIHCCDGNLCNGSQSKMASAFVLTACAVLAKFAVKTLAE